MSDRTRCPWWLEEDPTDAAKGACDAAAAMRTDQRHRWSMFELATCLYDDASGSDLDTDDFTFEITDGESATPLNLVRSCIDTVHAELIQSKARPKFTPVAADWSIRRKCQQLDRFCLGVFNSEVFDRIAAALALDLLVYGTAIVRAIVEDGVPGFDRIPPWELWCDPDEGRYGKPRTLYLTRYISRDVLKARFPDSAEAIDTARGKLGTRAASRVAGDMVAYVEAWHLPSCKGAGDGKHVLCVDGEMLDEEEWPHSWFPFSFARWKTPTRGFWGQGLAGELLEAQRELNTAVQDVQVGRSLHAHTHIAASRASGLDPEEMTDEPGVIWWYNGNQPPIALTFPGVSPETYQWIKDIIAWGYQLCSGVSQAQARSEKGRGLVSAVAIQADSDLQSKRFLGPARAYDQMHVDAGHALVRIVEHHARTDKSLEVVYPGKLQGERIKWSKARLDETSYLVRLDPVSSLPSSPSGRADWVEGMLTSGQAQQAGVPAGMIQQVKASLDVESFQQFITVSFDLVDLVCERILDDGEEGYTPPEPFFNLSVCLLVAVTTYQQWVLYGAPEDRRELLRDWIDDVRALMAASQPPAPEPPVAGAMGGAPSPAMAPEAAPPVMQ